MAPVHTNSADPPLAQGNAEADRLAAMGCVAPHLMTQQRRPSAPTSRSQSAVPPRSTRPPSRSWTSATLARGRLRRRTPPGTDRRLPYPSTHASPCFGVPFSVASLNAFVLILILLSLLMTIMRTSLLVTTHFPGCKTRFSHYSVTGLATFVGRSRLVFYSVFFGWGYVINHWIFNNPVESL